MFFCLLNHRGALNKGDTSVHLAEKKNPKSGPIAARVNAINRDNFNVDTVVTVNLSINCWAIIFKD